MNKEEDNIVWYVNSLGETLVRYSKALKKLYEYEEEVRQKTNPSVTELEELGEIRTTAGICRESLCETMDEFKAVSGVTSIFTNDFLWIAKER